MNSNASKSLNYKNTFLDQKEVALITLFFRTNFYSKLGQTREFLTSLRTNLSSFSMCKLSALELTIYRFSAAASFASRYLILIPSIGPDSAWPPNMAQPSKLAKNSFNLYVSTAGPFTLEASSRSSFLSWLSQLNGYWLMLILDTSRKVYCVSRIHWAIQGPSSVGILQPSSFALRSIYSQSSFRAAVAIRHTLNASDAFTHFVLFALWLL